MTQFTKLVELASKIGSGQTPTGGYRSYLPKGIPLIRSQNVLMGKFSTEGLAYISDSIDQEMAGSRVEEDDVLLNITGASIGRVCVVPPELCPANVNQHVCIIRCGKNLSPDYLAALLASPHFQKKIYDLEAGGTRQALTKAMIEDFKIPVLPVGEQKKMATHLKAQLAEVETARSAVTEQLLDVKALTDAIVFDSTRTAAKPASLGDALDEVKKGVGSDWASYPVLGATREGLAPAKEPPGKHGRKYKLATPGTVFYNPMRILIGSIAFVDDDDKEGITSPDYVVLRGKQGITDSRWFYHWLRSPLGQQCILSLARGAVRERMLFNRLADGKIALPDHDVQVRASEALAELKPLKRALQLRLSEINLLPQKILSTAFEM